MLEFTIAKARKVYSGMHCCSGVKEKPSIILGGCFITISFGTPLEPDFGDQ